MKIEKISENKIKVLIDGKEAQEWNISFKSISENTPAVQEMFWTAIRMAEENTGFSVDGAKLFVEALQCCDGDDKGFGMLITRVCSDAELNTAISSCGYKGRIKQARLPYCSKTHEKKYIYCFNDFDTLCSAAGEVFDIYTGKGTLYKHGGKFYLCLTPKNAAIFADIEMTILEFGTKVKNGQYMLGRLNEYGNVMIKENAVDIIAKYFCLR